MPGKQRAGTGAGADATFGLEKLSLGGADAGTGGEGKQGREEDVGAEGARGEFMFCNGVISTKIWNGS